MNDDLSIACSSCGMTTDDSLLLHATKMHMAGTNMSEVPLFEAWVTPRNFRSVSRDAARLGWMARASLVEPHKTEPRGYNEGFNEGWNRGNAAGLKGIFPPGEPIGYASQRHIDHVSKRFPILVYETAAEEFTVPVYTTPPPAQIGNEVEEAAYVRVGAGVGAIKLEHVAVAEDGGNLRWMTGRKPRDCELYAMPDGGNAPATLYTAPPPASTNRLTDAKIDAAILEWFSYERDQDDFRARMRAAIIAATEAT